MCTARKVNFSSQGYSANTHVKVVDFQNGFTVKNRGNCFCLINNEPLNPGESKGFICWPEETYGGRIDIVFRNMPGQVMPVVRMAWVTQKFFINKP